MDFTSLTKDEILSFADIDGEYAEAVKSIPSGLIDFSYSSKAVGQLRYFTSLAQIPEPEPEVNEETIQIPARDGHNLKTLVFRPHEKPNYLSPLVVLYYGGGYIFGFPEMMTRVARLLVKKLGAVVVAPSYRHAPEHPFPAAVNDTWDALTWAVSNAKELQADTDAGFVVGGNDVGANLSIAVAHLAGEKVLTPKLTGLYIGGATFGLSMPDKLETKYSDRLLSPQQSEILEDKLENAALVKLGEEMYKPDFKSKLYNPFQGDGQQDLPRTYLQVCGRDMGRDHALVLDDMLKTKGVATRLDMYRGLPHDFWYPLKQHTKTLQWEKYIIDGFAWTLGVSKA